MAAFFSKAEAKTIATLALPVALAQLAQVSMGFVDTVVAGRAGAVDMAGVALGASFWNPVTLFGQGLLMAITPLVAQAIGAGNREGLGRYLRQGTWLALVIGVCLFFILQIIARLILNMDSVEPDLRRMASGYLGAIAWGVPGMILYNSMRCFQEGHGRTRPAMIAAFIGLLFNIPLNFILVFGLLGFPAMGGVGCGVASAVVCWIMCLVMFFSVRKSSSKAIRFEPFMGKIVGRIARISFPGAMALLLEVLSFSIITILIAHLGAQTVAGHQVAMNVSSLLFAIPLSLGSATTIRVGGYLGQKNKEGAKTVRLTSLSIALVLAMLTALLLILFRYPIASIYTRDPQVLSLAASLMFFNAAYQISDYTQMVTMTALRGYNDTRAIFIIALVAYWVIGLPCGYILGLTDWILPEPMGVSGFWIGLIIGLTVSAVLYLIRLAHLEKQPMETITAKINK